MTLRRSLLARYVASFVIAVGFPLIGYTTVGVWLTSQEHRSALINLQQANAQFAAYRLGQFMRELEGHLRFATHLGWDYGDDERQRIDALRVLRQAPAIADVSLLDETGRERVFVSRMSVDRVTALADRSDDAGFLTARRTGTYYGPVYLRRDSEPFITIAVAGPRPGAGVVLAEVNLTHVRDVILKVPVGRTGQAYVVDGEGRLIAHADMSAVLRKTDLSRVLRTIRSRPDHDLHRDVGFSGQQVVLTSAPVPPLDWTMIVELPETEANEQLDRALWRSAAVALASLLAATVIAAVLAWRMVHPIRVLSLGAARIGAGQLDHRIEIGTGDEVARLGHHFNDMASDLERSYATLERKVADRTRELSEANRSKSRFLAAASHDLRQPLHALNLLVAQLSQSGGADERQRLTTRIEQAVVSINGLFDDLLDISKLEAGIVRPELSAFPVRLILERVEAALAPDAHRKGLDFRMRATPAWVLSDPIIVQRIVSNLVSNAIRYTERGGVLVGCRVRGEVLRLEVWDTGVGIAPERQDDIFSEFYQIDGPQQRNRQGLGLGLAIVARLADLLGHEVTLTSVPGRGSCFRVMLPLTSETGPVPDTNDADLSDPLRGVRIVVIDNDPIILESTAGLLRNWGCEIVTARSYTEAAAGLTRVPHAVLADLHLAAAADDGISTIAKLREKFGAPIPALIVSGDVSADARQRAAAAELLLLEKPVSPLRLKTVLTRLLKARSRVLETSSPVS